MTVPTLLPPISTEKSDDGQGQFHEATVPTSLLWACLVSQCAASKKHPTKRRHATTVVFEILMACFRAGDLSVQMQHDNATELIRVPGSGTIIASLVLGHLTERQRVALKRAWVSDAQDD